MTVQLPLAPAKYDANLANQTNARVNTRLTNAEGVTGALQTLTQNGIMIGQSGNAMTPKNPTTIAVGTNGQLLLGQTSAAPAWGTMSGDGIITNAGALTVTKTNGVAFAASATTDTTVGNNITSGTVSFGRFPQGTNGQIITGQTGAQPSWQSMAGDGTFSSAGVLTIYNTAINNVQITTSVATNILTVNLKTATGNDPSASSPINVVFRDSTLANGDPVLVQITSALNMTTNAAGASLGTANNQGFRLWLCAFNNAGTVVLALWQSVTGGASPTAIAALNEMSLQSTTGISGAATSAGTFYTPNGTSLTSKAFRILGFMEWGSGLATAGNYASNPTEIQLFGLGVKKPNEVVQTVYATQNTDESSASTTYIASTNGRITITPTSAANLVRVTHMGILNNGTAGDEVFSRWSRGTTNATNLIGGESGGSVGTNGFLSAANLALDGPNTTTSQTYCVQYRAGVGGTAHLSSGQVCAMLAQEIMT